jgi:hypothetical protein
VNGYLVDDREPSTLAQKLLDATELRDRTSIAATVEHIEARNVIRELFDVLDPIAA